MLNNELNYDMQNKKISKCCYTVEIFDVLTRDELSFLMNKVNWKHEELFQSLIVVNSTSEKHIE